MNRPVVTLASLMAFAPIGLYARSMANRNAEPEACGALANLRIEDTNLLSATLVPAAGDVPGYCRVLGSVRPAINFEIRLPTKTWNGKLYMAGAVPTAARSRVTCRASSTPRTTACAATTPP